jgi:hypothetical protein
MSNKSEKNPEEESTDSKEKDAARTGHSPRRDHTCRTLHV